MLTPRALALAAELKRRAARSGKMWEFFPAEGPFRRELYPQHMDFFAASAIKTVRLFLAANGVGKTLSGAIEMAFHLTGLYPDWWTGHRYKRPTRFWIAGQTKQTTRDIQQTYLLGKPKLEQYGGGMVPADLIDIAGIQRWPGGGGLIEFCRIKHASGGWSELGARTYDQAIDAWYGDNLDGGWLDEIVPMLYFSELFTRTRSSDHPLIWITFTPLKGVTELVAKFLQEPDESRIVIPCGWDHVPHLSEKWKLEKLANTPEYLHDTVGKGVPSLGTGAVFPIVESAFVIDPLEQIPDHWPRAFGFDGGWHNTAAVWGAYDRDTRTWYIYDDYKAGKLIVPVHAASILSRGKWIPGVGDVRLKNVTDGSNMLDEYEDVNCPIQPAQKQGKEARIEKCRKGLTTGKIKVYKTCRHFLNEYRMYHYDDNGNLVKENDHVMDAFEHLIDEGPSICKTHSEVTMIHSAGNDRPIRFGRRI